MISKKKNKPNCRTTVKNGSSSRGIRGTRDGSSLKRLGELATQIQDIARQAVTEYTSVVKAILRSESKDVAHIENVLDGLLDFCFDPDALGLFKTLCRYYYAIDPQAAAEYVLMYRDMWDEQEGRQSCTRRRATDRENSGITVGRGKPRSNKRTKRTSTKVAKSKIQRNEKN
jgi:hypothetical protein